MNHAALDILVHVFWSTCTLGMKFWGYFTSRETKRAPKGIRDVAHWRLKGKKGHMMVVFSVPKCFRKEKWRESTVGPEVRTTTMGRSHINSSSSEPWLHNGTSWGALKSNLCLSFTPPRDSDLICVRCCLGIRITHFREIFYKKFLKLVFD